MSNGESHSVTRWITALKQGRSEAAAALWDDYFDRLVRLARYRIGGAPWRGVEDEEDAALSAFLCLCKGAARGKFDRLTNRGDLWRLLTAILSFKLQSQFRRRVPVRPLRVTTLDEAALAGSIDHREPRSVSELVGREAGPEAALECAALLESLPDGLRQIAFWRLEGRTNLEIAETLGVVERTVERKLERIRALWIEEVISPPAHDD